MDDSTQRPAPKNGGKRTSKGRIRERLEALIAEYGATAVVTYLTIFFGTWAGFAIAISIGVDVEGVAAGAGTVGAAWVATKVTQPLRIGATLVMTPLVARAWHRIRPPAVEVVAVSEGTASDESDIDDEPEPS